LRVAASRQLWGSIEHRAVRRPEAPPEDAAHVLVPFGQRSGLRGFKFANAAVAHLKKGFQGFGDIAQPLDFGDQPRDFRRKRWRSGRAILGICDRGIALPDGAVEKATATGKTKTAMQIAGDSSWG
jgi:hypothetical protein